jgi:hypothetical protein
MSMPVAERVSCGPMVAGVTGAGRRLAGLLTAAALTLLCASACGGGTPPASKSAVLPATRGDRPDSPGVQMSGLSTS